MTTPDQGPERKALPQGAIIFEAGDPGGDLYFVEEGTVEVYLSDGTKRQVLSEANRGEVIGILTCLLNEPRLASARAKAKVIIKKIPFDTVRKTVDSVPEWLRVMIREFSTRIKLMNTKFLQISSNLENLKNNQASYLYTGTQIAGSMEILAKVLARPYDGEDVIFFDDLLNQLEIIFNKPKEEIKRVIEVFGEAGIAIIKSDLDKKNKIIKLANAQKWPLFAQFVNEFKKRKI